MDIEIITSPTRKAAQSIFFFFLDIQLTSARTRITHFVIKAGGRARRKVGFVTVNTTPFLLFYSFFSIFGRVFVGLNGVHQM